MPIPPSKAKDDLLYDDVPTTAAGFVYFAVALEVFSGRVVGWAMADHLRTELVLAALDIALGQRRPHSAIHDSEAARTPRWRSASAAAKRPSSPR